MNQRKIVRRRGGEKAPRTYMHLSLPPEEVAQLKTIMGWMLTDPTQESAKPCYQTTVRYALAHMIANPPSHVRPPEG